MLSDSQRKILEEYSLLGLIFDRSDWPRVFSGLEILEASVGEIVVNEGASADVYIPLSGEVELFSLRDGTEHANGVVQNGRTINLYAILRNRPFQYSARFRSAGAYVRFPASQLRAVLERKPALEKYLILMSENPDVRAMAKEIDALGCSREFKVAFIACLRTRDFAPQEWLLGPNDIPSETFFIIGGQLVWNRNGVTKTTGLVNQWPLPSRKWLCWRQFLEQKPIQQSLKAISSAKALALTRDDLTSLLRDYSADVEIYSSSILSGHDPTTVESEADEELDLEEFSRKTSKQRRFWQSYPWVQQNDQMDCGPACMAMISLYYDRKVSIQFWRSRLSTNREGTSLFDLAKMSERCGFTSYALEVTSLGEHDPTFFPIIVLRKYHYMVVFRVTSKWIIVGDPGIGIRRMSHKEFYDGFQNAVLFLRPNEAFFSLPESTRKYRHFFALLNGLQREMALNFLVSLMTVGLGLLTPILSQVFMDEILVKKDMSLFKIALTGLSLVAILNGFLGWTQNYYANYLATKFDFKVHSVFFKKMLSLSYRFFAERHVGDFTKRLNEISKIRDFMLKSVEGIILSVLKLLIYTAALFLYAPKIALVVFGVTPVFFLISWVGGRKLSSTYQRVFKESAELESYVTDTVKGISSVKSIGAELAGRWRYEEKFVRLLKAERQFSLTSTSIGVFADLYSHVVNSLIMGLAAYMAIEGDLSPGQVVAVTMIASNMLGPLASLAGCFGEIQEVLAVCGRLNDVLLVAGEKVSNRGRVKKDIFRGEIEFRDVWFRYGGEGSDWVLKGVSFKIEAGTDVAFVGPSGSGKSTIAALITRMHEPTRGQIFIDGRDLLDYDIDWLRGQVGVLYQESHLFEGSIFENIAFSDPEVDIARAQEAARKAAADEFILKKSSGYEYMISAGGLGLSGGERQRIAMARTFYREPKMLILDEATSALDGIAENALLLNLKKVAGRMTIINIAHRYSTVKYSDYALVLFDGKVMGFGTHNELLADNEIYQRLFNPQIEGSIEVRRSA